MSTAESPNVRGLAPARTGAPNPLTTLRGFLHAQQEDLSRGIYKGLSPARMIDIVCSAASRAPDLLNCTPLSIYRSLKSCAQLGLEPMTPQRHAYLVPFRNKNNTTEAQLIIGYQGLCELALRHERVKSIRAHVVYEGEDVQIVLEPPSVSHRWDWAAKGDRTKDKILGAYAIAELTTGATVVEPMTVQEVEAVRARSRAKDSGPWVTDYEAMVRKTVIRRLLQRGSVPMSSELGMAYEAEREPEGETMVAARATISRSVALDSPAEPDNPLGEIPLNPPESERHPKAKRQDKPQPQPTQEQKPEKPLHEQILALAAESEIKLEAVFAEASRIAGKQVTSTRDLEALPVDVLCVLLDSLEPRGED